MVWRSKICRQTRQLPEGIHAKTCLLLQKESFFKSETEYTSAVPSLLSLVAKCYSYQLPRTTSEEDDEVIAQLSTQQIQQASKQTFSFPFPYTKFETLLKFCMKVQSASSIFKRLRIN